MKTLDLLAQIDPREALHAAWENTSPEVHLGTGSAGFLGWLAGVNWAAVGSVLAIVIPIVAGSIAQTWVQIRRAQLELDVARRLAEARVANRKVDCLPSRTDTTFVLVPDTRSSG